MIILRVLIIDEDPDAAITLSKVLHELECEVITVCDPTAAAPLASRCAPDALFIDLELLSCDAFDMVNELRLDADLHDASFIAMSCNSASHFERAVKAGYTNFLAKPFDPSEIRTIVADLILAYR